MNVKNQLVCLLVIAILTLSVPNVAIASTSNYSTTFHNNIRHAGDYSRAAKGNTTHTAAVWSKRSDGVGDSEGFCVHQTTDDGYIVAGTTNFSGKGEQAYLLKTDSNGKGLWSKTYGDYGNEDASFVQQTTDGGYILAGDTDSYDNGTQVSLIKTDSAGNELWSGAYGESGSDVGWAVQQSRDGGYIVTGNTFSNNGSSSQIYLVKTDSTGKELWDNNYGDNGYAISRSVQQTYDGGYIIVGWTTSAFGMRVYLVKTDFTGKELWSKMFGGEGDSRGISVQETPDRGYIIAGETNSSSIYEQVYLIKTDFNGKEIWSKIFGADGDKFGDTVQQTTDGGFIVVGSTNAYDPGLQVFLLKTDSAGNKFWDKAFRDSAFSFGYFVQQTSDGGYIISGSTLPDNSNRQIYLLKTDSTGTELWSKVFG
jgi:hypothetical protein